MVSRTARLNPGPLDGGGIAANETRGLHHRKLSLTSLVQLLAGVDTLACSYTPHVRFSVWTDD
jgi:hypothetical protein